MHLGTQGLRNPTYRARKDSSKDLGPQLVLEAQKHAPCSLFCIPWLWRWKTVSWRVPVTQ